MSKLVPNALVLAVCAVGAFGVSVSPVGAQNPPPRVAKASEAGAAVVTPPADYVIGAEDQLSVVFYTDKGMSADVVVRPDGKISLPLINDIQTSGLTPDQLRAKVNEEAKKFIQEPNATVVVRQINSRKVSITGSIKKPGTYPLIGPMTILQLIATAGGLEDFAKSEKIGVIRTEGGRTSTLKFNYKEILELKNMSQNIELRPGDTVIVP